MKRTLALLMLCAVLLVGCSQKTPSVSPTPLVSSTPLPAQELAAARSQLEEVNRKLASSPGSPELLAERGDLQLDLGEVEASLTAYRAAIDAGFSDPGLKNQVAWCYCLQGKHKEAFDYADQAVREWDDYHKTLVKSPAGQDVMKDWSEGQAAYLDTRAVAAMGLGKLDQAEKDLDRALGYLEDDELRAHQKMLEGMR